MTKIRIERFQEIEGGVFGIVISEDTSINGLFTLENKQKIIPEGEYDLKVTWSPKFKKNLPLIIVPKRRGIRIHSGNFVSQSQGCIMVGLGMDPQKSMLLYSHRAMTHLMTYLNRINNKAKLEVTYR